MIRRAGRIGWSALEGYDTTHWVFPRVVWFVVKVSRIVFTVKALLVLLCMGLLLPAATSARAADAVFAPLRSYLLRQGVPARRVDALLNARGVRFEAGLLARLLARPEHKLNYRQFLSEKVVKRAREFKRRHRRDLREGRRLTGVEPEVVVAILTVESGLGAYTGRWSTFNVLASQAVLDTRAARERLARKWPKKQIKDLNSARMRARLARRAAWARGELMSLLELARRQGVSPLALRGSVAGALGMCQFVPSSVLRHGRDWDANGRLELHKPADAIASVGTYLSHYGWRPYMSRDEKIVVLLTYNNSRTYARTVLDLARRLR